MVEPPKARCWRYKRQKKTQKENFALPAEKLFFVLIRSSKVQK